VAKPSFIPLGAVVLPPSEY